VDTFGLPPQVSFLSIAVVPISQPELAISGASPPREARLRIWLDFCQGGFVFEWLKVGVDTVVARGSAGCLRNPEWPFRTFEWRLEDFRQPGRIEEGWISDHGVSAAAFTRRLRGWLPIDPNEISVAVRLPAALPGDAALAQIFMPEGPWRWFQQELTFTLRCAEAVRTGGIEDLKDWKERTGLAWLRERLPPEWREHLPNPWPGPARAPHPAGSASRSSEGVIPGAASPFLDWIREQRLAADAFHRRAELFRQREAERRRRRQEGKAEAAPATAPPASPAPVAPLPPIPLELEGMSAALQPGLLPLTDLGGWFLREQAMQWWVSNQTDDLLALPFCRIERLEYQIRTALRVIGPLRGRALLSDEVGLGKTIEAGLVLREYVTRGMVRRFLVVTLPSLVDQWAEELSDKFGLETQTTNQVSRSHPESLWRDGPGVVASLHTLKQAGHLAIARQVPWDLLIVDEAHHLRNRESQTWQAINALPRQFLLLLTATPVQNSLEELYNLVTLLQPGQLPSPKEFRARFVDPRRPRQPREPEELRRLLQQVMIRNTRSNAGIRLPGRQAHTVFFEPSEDERRFSQAWEEELRLELAPWPKGQSSLWGRLLLQAAGSSPAAWRDALERFPNAPTARRWRDGFEGGCGWQSKCALLPPLARCEGGVVIYSQFLATQAAVAEFLRGAGIPATVINGQTPAAQRQPLTEQFRRSGGVLLLTRSGTEGRNLQFSSRLINFDLPWNPMEIEQRIGRLHRLGQSRPVHIYNFVAKDTLQHHLLELLQEKLNLFELVVGETGLILGERFASEEFAEEILHRWQEAEGDIRSAFERLGDELVAARQGYQETRQLDQSLFANDFESA
jgi:superfamily II DNA or RNA helicase